MCPSVIIPLEELPLNVNGKLDRKALDAIALPNSFDNNQDFTDLGKEELTLLGMWQEVLPDSAATDLSITKDTDFFEAGGNSLSLVRLQSLIKTRLGVQIPLVQLVEFCSLEAIARQLQSTDSVPSTQFE